MEDLTTIDMTEIDEVFEDWRKHLEINKDALDEEWLHQPELMMHFATLEAEAKRDFDTAWEESKITRSRLLKEIKEEKPKLTKDMLEAEYRDHEDHKKAKQEMIDAEYRHGRVKAMVWAVNQRKTALEGLVRLYGQEYWSAPAVSNMDPEVARSIKKESGRTGTNKAVKESKKRRRRRTA